MAVIDESRNVLVVRIVYDGPALSGKTTSLKALARGVGSQLECPAEVAGRTLFFDWVDYVGGLFDGRQIRCQIVSVPGQRDLSERRRFLVEGADAVVLVLDTRQHEWEFGLSWVARTASYCRAQDPPIGLVLQANKRDAPDAVSPEILRESLAKLTPVAVVPSMATAGDGIRETFVLAVRMALDRVRALAATGRLPKARPAEDAPEDLLRRLREVESEPALPVHEQLAMSVTSSLRSELDPMGSSEDITLVDDDDGSRPEAPFTPDPMMPGGMIWPPVDGRALLHEVASLAIKPARTGRADWAGSGSGFRFHSVAGAIFADSASARHALLEWARLHSANAAHLSSGRAVILADAGAGRLRLWQIVRSEATLRERLAAALTLADPAQVARALSSVATQLSIAREFFDDATVALPCTLWTVGASASRRPPFVGLMPDRNGAPMSEPYGLDLIFRELSPQLRELRRTRVDYAEVVRHVGSLAESAAARTPARWLADLASAT